MPFEKIEVGKEADFVKYWSEIYKAKRGGKDYRFLTSTKQSGKNEGCPNEKVEHVVEKIEAINAFRNGKLEETEFDKKIAECFPNGGGVWHIFVKHIACPWDFPIFDNHVWSAYCCLKGKGNVTLSFDYYVEYRDYFLSLYKDVHGTDERKRGSFRRIISHECKKFSSA